jgi:LmbE family N-acetylglucosaminyl deacetylase
MQGRVLVIAAHPDDEILGMGGTIARHVALGDEVTVLWVTDGSTAQYPDDPGMVERKYAEADMALEVLGVKPAIRGGLPDMRLDTLAHIDVNRVVELAFAQARPETVYCVHPDVNRDHRAVFESAAVVTRPRPGTPVRRFLTYGTPSGVEWTPEPVPGFRPTVFVDVTAHLPAKIAAFGKYASETRPWPHPRSSKALTAIAESWGCGVGVAAAEAFTLVRELAV